jgi:hypothetical protein
MCMMGYMNPVAPKWVTDLVMNLLYDAEQDAEHRLTAEQHLNIVPLWMRSAAGAILGYRMQYNEAAAPPADDATNPVVRAVPAPVSPSEAVTSVMPLIVAPVADPGQHTVPANAPGR